MFANRKERGPDAISRKSVEHHAGIAGPRSIVEGEHDLVREQEVVRLILRETETWSASCVYFDRANDTQRVGIGARLLPNCQALQCLVVLDQRRRWRSARRNPRVFLQDRRVEGEI